MREGRAYAYITVLLVVFFLFIEVKLRIEGTYDSYMEKIGYNWRSPYATDGKVHSGIRKYNPDEEVTTDHGEFSFTWRSNRLGYRESKPITDSGKSIFIYGDSFIEGVGAPEDSTIVSQINRRLAVLSDDWNAFNFGVTGSDPYFDLRALTQLHADLQPTAVLFAVNESDLNDVIIRGGQGRFREDGTTKYRSDPWFVPFYGASHIVRALVHALGYDWLFVHPKDQTEVSRWAKATLLEALDEAHAFCESRDIRFMMVCIPLPIPHCSGWEEQISGIDWKDLNVIRLDKSIPDTICGSSGRRFYWPIDGHYNGRGYTLLGDVIFDEIMAQHPDFFTIDSVP